MEKERLRVRPLFLVVIIYYFHGQISNTLIFICIFKKTVYNYLNIWYFNTFQTLITQFRGVAHGDTDTIIECILYHHLYFFLSNILVR